MFSSIDKKTLRPWRTWGLTGSFCLPPHTSTSYFITNSKGNFTVPLRNWDPCHGIIQLLFLNTIALDIYSLTIYWLPAMCQVFVLSLYLFRSHFSLGISQSFCLLTVIGNSEHGSKPLKRPIWSAKYFVSHSSPMASLCFCLASLWNTASVHCHRTSHIMRKVVWSGEQSVPSTARPI